MTEKTLDALFSKVVRTLQPRCRRCGSPSEECAHIFTRSRRSTRWDIDNALGLCARCHRWAHANPTEFMYFVSTLIGSDGIEALRRRSQQISKDRDLPAIALDLRLILERKEAS